MIKFLKCYYSIFLLIIFCFSFVAHSNNVLDDENIRENFWLLPKKGTNIFNKEIIREDIIAAKKYGFDFVRIAPDKFISNNKDFLLGNADDYIQLDVKDLIKLKKILDVFYEEKMPVLLTMLSLPGSRWRQNNNFIDDLRIWQDKKFQKQASLFWKNLISEIHTHPALVGINILNEPHPEKIISHNSEPSNLSSSLKSKLQDNLSNFYEQIIKVIRQIDPKLPIILDSSSYGDPQAFSYLTPFTDPFIIYSFHMYTPFEYTNKKINNGKFIYPGIVYNKYWDKFQLQQYLKPVIDFQKKYNISSSRILVGEFGGHRETKGLNIYFQDLIQIFNTQQWHHAFYAFREDCWNGMDYEIGNKKLPYQYWEDIKLGKNPTPPRTSQNIIFKTLLKGLQK